MSDSGEIKPIPIVKRNNLPISKRSKGIAKKVKFKADKPSDGGKAVHSDGQAQSFGKAKRSAAPSG